ncbi:MAG: thermonuclease family protein [Xanthobacteraceae bacterium]
MSTRARWPSAGGGWTSPIFLAVTVISPHLAFAENEAARADSACRPATFASGFAGHIVDGRTFVLQDGREVRLAGIEAPAEGAAAAQARQQLERLLGDKAILLKGFPGRDRYGRLVAQVFRVEGDGERWVQPELLATGHARLAARVGDRACAAALVIHERSARGAALGLWSDPYYGLHRAEEPAAVAAERGRFAIVEGNVLSVRESGGTIYVNFGRRWSEDFTVTIAKRNERTFAAAGLEPKSFAGRRIRVRGWIEERGGPWVEATRPEQIELMERN